MYPVLFSSGPINIYSFGVFLVLAFLAGTFYVWREARSEFEDELLIDTILVVIVCAILGARLFYILSHLPKFGFNILNWVHIYLFPGFSFWGSVLGGLIGGLLFTQKKKVSFWRMGDFLVLGAGLGVIFGQIGCFFNGCTVGKLTNLPWGMTIIGFVGKRHPVALYDALAALLIFLVVYRVYRWIFAQKRQRKGNAGLAYLALLGVFSFTLEFLKEGGLYFYGLNLNQAVALFFFLGAGSIWVYSARNLREDLIYAKKKVQELIFRSGSKGGENDKIS